MSSPAVQPKRRVPRLAQEAVDRARLTVVPRIRSRAPRMPFVSLVSLVLVGGVVGLLMFNTSMQQASFAVASLEATASARLAPSSRSRATVSSARHSARWKGKVIRCAAPLP